MYQLSQKDFEIRKQEKETKEDIDRQKKMQKEAEEYSNEMKAICMEFFNTKIIPANIPISLLEEYFVNYFRASIAIYKTKSEEWKNYMESKEKYELTPIRKLTIKDEQD